jgi:outer membrane immunogenic protein
MYVGVHLGGASQFNQLWDDSYNAVSAVAGGQIGYNWQQGRFVFGLEADGSWLSKSDNYWDQSCCGGQTATYGSHISWVSTVRGRLGYAFGDRGDWLAYTTAGLAIGGLHSKDADCCVNNYSYSKTRLGWAFGGGLEHMLTRNWTVAAEALYVDFGTWSSDKVLVNGNAKGTRATNSAVIGRLKLNYKF